MAEFHVTGCRGLTNSNSILGHTISLKAFPVPTSGFITVALPLGNIFDYSIVSLQGQTQEEGRIESAAENYNFNMNSYASGMLFDYSKR